MRAPTLRLLVLLLCTSALVGCDREPVVAGTYQRSESGALTGQGGAGGQADNTAGTSAGMGGAPSSPPECVYATWYVAAEYVDQMACKLEPNERSLQVLFWLSVTLPFKAEAETRPFSGCNIEWWLGMRTTADSASRIAVCEDWCLFIRQSYAAEQERLLACMVGGMP